MVSHGSNKYSHAYLTVTQVFIHHRFCWHRTIETAKKTFRTQKLSNRNGSTKPYEWAQHLFCFFFDYILKYDKIIVIWCQFFFVYISSSFFPVHLKVSNSLVFRYYRFFYLIIQSWKKWFTTCYWKHRMKLEITKIYYVHCTIVHLLIGNYIAQMA